MPDCTYAIGLENYSEIVLGSCLLFIKLAMEAYNTKTKFDIVTFVAQFIYITKTKRKFYPGLC